ncbi:MAG: hypothetical protein M0Z46_12740 [Actinomycetota bacterium]|nr:hypothetical protein [Actinomycetota bacterium]
MAPRRRVVGVRHVAGALPPGAGRIAMVESSTFPIEEWMEQRLPEGLVADPSYWSIDEVVNLGTAVKGGPGETKVRTAEGVATMRRWEHNARLRRVATAVYPATSPTDAVRRWYEHGGSMQVLRWSDAQVDEFVAAVHDERETAVAQPGDRILRIRDSDRTAEQRRDDARRYRGTPGSEKREHFNALRRRQQARARERKMLRERRRRR